jgi:uncharacterized protein (TIGR03083 family)
MVRTTNFYIGVMTLDYPRIIADESARIVQALRTGPLDARVPGCPDWSLGALGLHVVGVQRWGAATVAMGAPPQSSEPQPPLDQVADALAASSAALLEALAAVDPDAPCWNFTSADQTARFWFRRQALEVAMHRWDADSAIVAEPAGLALETASDLVDEFVHVMMQRVIDRENLALDDLRGDIHVHCTDTAGEWVCEIIDGRLVVTDEHRKSAVAVRGPASDLALFLYNRVPASTVEILGDAEVLASWDPVLRF